MLQCHHGGTSEASELCDFWKQFALQRACSCEGPRFLSKPNTERTSFQLCTYLTIAQGVNRGDQR